MSKDFKKAGYFCAFMVFVLGIAGLLAVILYNYFSYDVIVELVGMCVSIMAFFTLMIICVLSKSRYNKMCIYFAEYISGVRKKDAKHAQELKNQQAAAAAERESAVSSALEKGRAEGAARARSVYQPPQPPRPAPEPQVIMERHVVPYIQQVSANDEVLYNEYGEPVLIRRRMKRPSAPREIVTYDDVTSDSQASTVGQGQGSQQGNAAPQPVEVSRDGGIDYLSSRASQSPVGGGTTPNPINVDPYDVKGTLD